MTTPTITPGTTLWLSQYWDKRGEYQSLFTTREDAEADAIDMSSEILDYAEVDIDEFEALPNDSERLKFILSIQDIGHRGVGVVPIDVVR